MGMARSPGDASKRERAGEHRPAEQVPSPVAARVDWGCPPRSIFPLGKAACVIPEKPENSHAFAKWKKRLLPKSEVLHPWTEFLPVTLFTLNENFRHGWPVRMWDVPSCDFFHGCPVFGSAWPHACPNGWETTQQDTASGVNRQQKPLSTCLCTGQETWGAEGVDSGKTSAAAPSSGDGAALRGAEHSVSLSCVPGVAKDSSVARRK